MLAIIILSSYKIGVAKIVSYADDGTLSSTAHAMNNFLRGTNSTIGIVPDFRSVTTVATFNEG